MVKFRKKKGGIKVHTFDVETQIPAFFHIIETPVHDSKAMNEILYDQVLITSLTVAITTSRCYIRFHQIGGYFIVRAKKNLQYKSIIWKRRLPKNRLSGANVLLTRFYPKQYYPEPLRLIRYWDEERDFTLITNAAHISGRSE